MALPSHTMNKTLQCDLLHKSCFGSKRGKRRTISTFNCFLFPSGIREFNDDDVLFVSFLHKHFGNEMFFTFKFVPFGSNQV